MAKFTSRNFKVNGIILLKRDFFEADKLIEILTEEKGKIRCVVRGAKKSKSKLSGLTELFIYGEYFLAKGKSIDIITGAKPTIYFGNDKNLDKISYYFLISEIIKNFLPVDVENPDIFHETIEIFKKTAICLKPFLIYEYIYKIISLSGYELSFESCLSCNNKFGGDESIYISFKNGGAICSNCHSTHEGTFKLPKDTVKILNYINNNNIDIYAKLKISEKNKKEITSFIGKYLNYLNEDEFNSTKFIHKIKSLQ